MNKLPQIILNGIEGPVAGKRYTFENTDVLFGREPGCHIVIRSNFVSRRHCALRLRNGRFELEDLGARTPARVNGGSVSGPVRPGDVLSVADARFRIDFPEVWSREERPTRQWSRQTLAMDGLKPALQDLYNKLPPPPALVAFLPPALAEKTFTRHSTAGPLKPAEEDWPEIELESEAPAPQSNHGAHSDGVVARFKPLNPYPRIRPRTQAGGPPPLGEDKASYTPVAMFTDEDLDALDSNALMEDQDEPTRIYPIPTRTRSWIGMALGLAGLAVMLAGFRTCTGDGQTETQGPVATNIIG